ncbi:MAG: hypothetical protein ABTR92_19755 [Candidatus Accumulibacter phosphatis]
MNSAEIVSLVPDDATLFDVAEEAAASGMHLISNGRRSAISPTVPAGWTRIAVRQPASATSCTPCSAR